MRKDMTRRTTALLATVMLFAFLLPHAAAAEQQQVIHQLRVYEIFDNNKQAFHERFRDHAMRIMARYDFKIVAIWETQHDGRTAFASWARFMADQEWSDIKKRTAAAHGRLVGAIEDRVLEVQDYSPTQVFRPEKT